MGFFIKLTALGTHMHTVHTYMQGQGYEDGGDGGYGQETPW
jgi:hypothetical protein